MLEGFSLTKSNKKRPVRDLNPDRLKHQRFSPFEPWTVELVTHLQVTRKKTISYTPADNPQKNA
jgi:hypothetical protein